MTGARPSERGEPIAVGHRRRLRRRLGAPRRAWWPLAAALAAGMVFVQAASASGASAGNDRTIAQAGALTLQDFPDGWAPTPQSVTNSDAVEAKLVRGIPACKAFIPLLANAKSGTRVRSASQFTDGGIVVGNDTLVFSQAQNATKVMTALHGDVAPCVQPLLRKSITAELATMPNAPKVQRIGVAVQSGTPGLRLGDDQGAFAATVTVSANGVQDTIYFEQLTVRVGRALVSFSYQSEGSPVRDLVPTAVTASVDRVEAALTA